MDRITYNGKVYTRRTTKWTDGNEIVCETMQRKLNKAFEEHVDITSLSFDSLCDKGALYKENGDYMRAIAYFERALLINPYWYGVRRILASLSSCYRLINHPEKSLALWSQYEDRSFLITPPFLTSIGAAYMDHGDVFTARRMAGRAFVLNGYYADLELSNLYRRINCG